tara:strand:+ start:348 stop:590 length:243 start_codon:yes stop_codon:yes gene_type:complete
LQDKDFEKGRFGAFFLWMARIIEICAPVFTSPAVKLTKRSMIMLFPGGGDEFPERSDNKYFKCRSVNFKHDIVGHNQFVG